MNRSIWLFALLLLGACRTPLRVEAPAASAIVLRTQSVRDSSAAHARLGHLSVAVRAVDDPTDGLLRATIRVWRVGVDSTRFRRREASADTLGIARFDSLPAGDWRVEGFRIGYKRHSIIVQSVPGCRTVVELYLALSPSCLFECTTTAPRSVVTTCAPDE